MQPSINWFAEIAWLAGTSVVAVLVSVFALELWAAPLRIPFVATSDGLLGVEAFKGVIENGWYFHNPAIGAPHGLDSFDFSAFDADNLQWLLVRAMAVFTSDPGLLVNAYFLLGFPLIAAATYIVLRGLNFDRPIAAAGGVILCALPFHWAHGQGHIFLSAYFVVPASGWLILRALTGAPLASRGMRSGRFTRWLTPVTLGSSLAIILAGGTTLYYAVFSILLLGGAAVIRSAGERSLRAGLPAMACAAAIGCVLVINLLPAIVHTSQAGRNPAVAARLVVESEMYSTTLTKMLLPSPAHRIDAFARIGAEQQHLSLVKSEGGTQLGLLLSLGFVLLLITLFGQVVRRRAHGSERERLLAAAAAAGMLAFLFATFGGLGELVATLVSPQIRAWNRITPFVAFFALVGVAVVAQAAFQRFSGRSRGWRALAAAVLALVTAGAVLDQTPSGAVPDYDANAASWRSDGRFVAAIEELVPPGSMILQLPFHQFPEEWGTGHAADYDLFRGYVHSKNLRWSYGAMKGRSADWTDEASYRPTRSLISAAAAAGFAGVYVDRWGTEDYGAALEAELRAILRSGPALTSADGRLAFYDLRAFAAEQRRRIGPDAQRVLGAGLVDPVDVLPDEGVIRETDRASAESFLWLRDRGVLKLTNRGGREVGMRMSGRLHAGGGTVVRITAPDGSRHAVRVGDDPSGTRFRVRFEVPPGASRLRFDVAGPPLNPADPRQMRAQLTDLVMEPTEVTR